MTAHHVADDGGPPGEGGAASPDAMALVGTPYRCLGRLGHGGMGVVLDAEHVALGKRVVVKLLHKEIVTFGSTIGAVDLGAGPVSASSGNDLFVARHEP